jgi:hypothetical protein
MMKSPKKIEVEVEMNGEPGPVSGMADEAMMADEENYDAMAPKGKFTPRGLGPLVKETNKLLPLFGQTPDYPMIEEELTQLPTDFVRVLSMFVAAVDDAIEADVLSPEMALTFDGVTDDRSLMLMAGKLNQIGKSMEFKRFLKEPRPEEETMTVDEERTPMPEMAEDEIDATFMERM